MDLSIIIVHYKTPLMLDKCLSSIANAKRVLDLEIIVVDNSPEDNNQEYILAKHKNIVWINNIENSGFARANNIGLKHCSGEYILYLNPDCEVITHSLDILIDSYKRLNENNHLGLLGCRIKSLKDNTLLVGSGIGFPNIWKIVKANPIFIFITRGFSNSLKYNPNKMHFENHEVDFVSGACALIKKETLFKHNLFFNEDFFLYYEDLELCYRAKKTGLKNYFCADTEIFHYNKASTAIHTNSNAQLQVSEYLFYLKSFSYLYYNLVGMLIWFNFKLNIFLNRKQIAKPEIKEIISQFSIFKKYYFKILPTYRRSGNKFLKFNFYD